jgi:hypothetical protein
MVKAWNDKHTPLCVIAVSTDDATYKLIKGPPGIWRIASAITLNAGAEVITVPKPTAAAVKNIGNTEPCAPSLITFL